MERIMVSESQINGNKIMRNIFCGLLYGKNNGKVMGRTKVFMFEDDYAEKKMGGNESDLW